MLSADQTPPAPPDGADPPPAGRRRSCSSRMSPRFRPGHGSRSPVPRRCRRRPPARRSRPRSLPRRSRPRRSRSRRQPRRSRRRPTAPPRRDLQHRGLAAAVLGLISLFALSAANLVAHALYLVTFAVVVGLIAIMAGASASRRAGEEETARPRGSLAAIILGVLSIALSALVAVGIVFASSDQRLRAVLQHRAHGRR